MSKLLLKNNNVMEFVDREKKILLVSPDMILTPGAKDLLRNNDIRISYGEEKARENKIEEITADNLSKTLVDSRDNPIEKKAMEEMSLDNQVKLLIRKEFNIAREADVQRIAKAVMEIIRERGQNYDD